MTIGDRFPNLGGSLEDAVVEVSGREFDVKCLRTYAHRLDLWKSCRQAVADLAGEPFAGRVSCAKLMGRAMERLRDTLGIDAPRGWYPVMKTLRKVSATPSSPASPDDDFPEVFGEGETNDVVYEFPVKAANLFRAHLSAVRGYDKWFMERALRAAAEERPTFIESLILVAEARGVPRTWGKESFDYAEAVIAELQRQEEPVPHALVRLREEMRERAIEFAASQEKASGPTGPSDF